MLANGVPHLYLDGQSDQRSLGPRDAANSSMSVAACNACRIILLLAGPVEVTLKS